MIDKKSVIIIYFSLPTHFYYIFYFLRLQLQHFPFLFLPQNPPIYPFPDIFQIYYLFFIVIIYTYWYGYQYIVLDWVIMAYIGTKIGIFSI